MHTHMNESTGNCSQYWLQQQTNAKYRLAPESKKNGPRKREEKTFMEQTTQYSVFNEGNK